MRIGNCSRLHSKQLLAGLLVTLLLLSTSSVSAHGGGPLHSVDLVVGAYTLNVGFFNWPLRAEQPFSLLIVPTGTQYQQRELSVKLLFTPAAGTPGDPKAAKVLPDSDSDSGYAVDAGIGVKGNWQMVLTVAGPQGEASTTLPVEVTGPPEMPTWLGWLIALAPLLGLVAFGWSQRKKLQAAPVVAADTR